jgi:hypothetical protein
VQRSSYTLRHKGDNSVHTLCQKGDNSVQISRNTLCHKEDNSVQRSSNTLSGTDNITIVLYHYTQIKVSATCLKLGSPHLLQDYRFMSFDGTAFDRVYKHDLSIMRVSDCCLTSIQQFFSYIMARTGKFSMR